MTWLPCHIMDVDLLKKYVYKDEIYCKELLLNMIWNEKLLVSIRVLWWRCVESQVNSECLHYGWFAISPFRSGQANIIGIVMRKTLLGRVEGTCITCAKFEKVMHQYSTILSIQELVHDILINLKKIVFKSNSNSCKTKKKKSIYFWTQRGNSSRYRIPTFSWSDWYYVIDSHPY